MFYLICNTIVIVSQLFSAVKGYSFLEENYSKNVLEDSRLNTDQLIAKYNYTAETHYVTTEDGYIICLHRIAKPNSPPVLMEHGLMDSSSGWIRQGPELGLGYYLSDNGYDVWLGNARGNHYSRNHTTLNPDKDRQYWSFSWHEIGYYDVPAMIDYILDKTKYKKIGYFGHSQGTTAFFIMASMRPEYNAKITMMHALAPAAFWGTAKFPLRHIIRAFLTFSEGIFTEFLPKSDAISNICFRSRMWLEYCMELFFLLIGKNPEQTDYSGLPVLLTHLPAGCSVKQFDHYSQLTLSGRFCQFDYGPKANMIKYGMKTPPSYPLEKVTAPVGLYYTHNDNIASVRDVKRLAKLLPNVVENRLYPNKIWNHIDILYNENARELMHKRMLELMKN